jgi:peptidyl-prolyl cis-trans isomerase A (cyclophilin A)
MKMYHVLTAIVVVLVVGVFLAQAQEGSKKTKATKTKSEKSTMQESVTKGNPVVLMKTSMGNISIELFQDKAPITVKNFLSYVDEKYYDNTVFHRVIKNFMIQGGGFVASEPIKEKKTQPPIKNEADNGVANDRGTIAMARTNDPNSATSQFFINVKDNAFLNRSANNPGYAVFGKVIEGMDIVDKIQNVSTGNAPAIARAGDKEMPTTFQDVPKTEVVVESIRRSVGAKK